MATTDQHPLPAVPGPRGALTLQGEGALSTQMLARGEPRALAEDRIDLKAVWRTLVKHKWTIVGITLLCTLAAGVYTLRITPQYQSTVLLQIDRAAQKVVGFNAEVEVDEGPASDQLQLRTQIELLKSRSLAERVIDEMGLYQPGASAPPPDEGGDTGTDEAAAPTGNEPVDKAWGLARKLMGNLRTLFTPSQADRRTLSRTGTVAQFEHAISVEPIRN